MRIGRGFSRFLSVLLKQDKNAAIPTKRQYKRITEKASRKRGVVTYGLPSRWNVSRVRHFGTFSPVKPFNF